MCRSGAARESRGRRVSHWTDADIERERKQRALQNVRPGYTLNERFEELLDLFDFVPFEGRSAAEA
jgi:hypothetical protein